MVQWLELNAPIAGGVGSIPGWGTKIPHAVKSSKKRKKERNYVPDKHHWANLFLDQNSPVTIFNFFFNFLLYSTELILLTLVVFHLNYKIIISFINKVFVTSILIDFFQFLSFSFVTIISTKFNISGWEFANLNIVKILFFY